MKEITIKQPRQRRSKAKFRAILEACPQVLRAYGYPKATTAKMALEADVSIGTLYNYFSCKEAVVLAYLDDRLNAAMDSVLERGRDRNQTPTQFVREFVQIGLDFAREQREIIKIALQAFPEKIINPDLTESRDKVLEIINSVYDSDMRLRLKEREPRIAVYILINIILGFQFRTVLMPEEDLPNEAVVDELTEIIVNYLFEGLD